MESFRLWFESTLVWSRKVKKPNIDNTYPFILTKNKVFLGRPSKTDDMSLHVEIEMEFAKEITKPYLRGRTTLGGVKIYDKEPDFYDYMDGIAALKQNALVNNKTPITFFDIHRNSWHTIKLNDLFSNISSPVVAQDPTEREVDAWLAPGKLSPEKVMAAREKDPYAYKYGE